MRLARLATIVAPTTHSGYHLSTRVEAEKSAPQIWAPKGGWSQWCNRLREDVETLVYRRSLMEEENVFNTAATPSRDGGACPGALPANAVGCRQSRAGCLRIGELCAPPGHRQAGSGSYDHADQRHLRLDGGRAVPGQHRHLPARAAGTGLSVSATSRQPPTSTRPKHSASSPPTPSPRAKAPR